MTEFATHYRKRDIVRAFSLALRAERIERGVSQDQLGEIFDLDRTYPSLLKRGLRCPTLTMLLRLAAALAGRPRRRPSPTCY